MDGSEVKRLKQLEDETRKLEHVVPELTLDNQALEDRHRSCRQAVGDAGWVKVSTALPPAMKGKTVTAFECNFCRRAGW